MHYAWMTLPSGDRPGRGEVIRRIAIERGLVAVSAVALRVDRAGYVSPSECAATFVDVIASLDQGVGGDDLGWRASAGEASVVIGLVTVGGRRGLVLRFMQSDFREFESAVKGGVLELIAALREACAAREVIWAREVSLTTMLELIDVEAREIPVGALEEVVALAEVSDALFEFMEIYGEEMWAGGLRFVAQRWARPVQ